MITVTGCDGFIGKHLLELLADANKECLLIDKKFWRDICDMTLDDIGDVVVHLAAVSSITESFADPEETMRTNILGLSHVIQLCKQKGAKLVFASSSSVEDPLSPYALSKLWGEELLDVSDIDYVALRFANVYGEGDTKSAIYHFKNNEKITIYGNGSQRRSFIYVKDVAEAIMESIETSEPGVYDIATEAMSINKVAELFNKPIVYKEEREGDARDLSMSSPDYVGRVKLEDWIKQ